MEAFIVTVTFQNGEFTYLVFAEDKNEAKHKANDFGVHCSPSVMVESVADAFARKHIPAVSRIR